MAVVRRDHVARWLEGYEEAWRTPGTDRLAELFTARRQLRVVAVGRARRGPRRAGAVLGRRARRARRGLHMSSEVIAVDADTAVVRVWVEYDNDPDTPWRDLWVLRFASGGRCGGLRGVALRTRRRRRAGREGLLD